MADRNGRAGVLCCLLIIVSRALVDFAAFELGVAYAVALQCLGHTGG